VEAGVPFFFKQWGEFAPFGTLPSDSKLKGHTWDDGLRWTSVAKVGKKKAGALLDGREWREFPQAVSREAANV
jgi:protein gp37